MEATLRGESEERSAKPRQLSGGGDVEGGMKDEEGQPGKEVRARVVVAEGCLKQKEGHRQTLGGLVYHSLSWVEDQGQLGWLQPEAQGVSGRRWAKSPWL